MMDIQEIPIDELQHDPENARLHDERNLEAIKKSLLAFGQQKPIVINQAGVILAGNGTYAAARSLGWKHISCVRSQLTDTQASAYAIADNRSAELASWDESQLVETLQKIESSMPDGFEATGFSTEDYKEMLDTLDGYDETIETIEPLPAIYQVMVVCKDEVEQRAAFEYLLEGGYACRLLTL